MDDENIKSKSEISNMLNNYFVNVGGNLSAQVGTGNLKASFINKMPSNMHSCFFQPIVPVEVYQVIQNQNSNKAAGSENILIRFYKIAGEWIANFLSEYFNKCLEDGCFPSALKPAKVKPIFKSRKRSSMNNYRPISLLSPLAKVFEKLISIRLNKFLEENNILADQQLVFR